MHIKQNKIVQAMVSLFVMIAIVILGGWGVFKFLAWYNEPPGYRALAKNFVFKIEPKFRNYLLAVNDLFLVRFQLSKNNLTLEERTALRKKLSKTKNHIDKSNKELDEILKQAIGRYGKEIAPSINQFIT